MNTFSALILAVGLALSACATDSPDTESSSKQRAAVNPASMQDMRAAHRLLTTHQGVVGQPVIALGPNEAMLEAQRMPVVFTTQQDLNAFLNSHPDFLETYPFVEAQIGTPTPDDL